MLLLSLAMPIDRSTPARRPGRRTSGHGQHQHARATPLCLATDKSITFGFFIFSLCDLPLIKLSFSVFFSLFFLCLATGLIWAEREVLMRCCFNPIRGSTYYPRSTCYPRTELNWTELKVKFNMRLLSATPPISIFITILAMRICFIYIYIIISPHTFCMGWFQFSFSSQWCSTTPMPCSIAHVVHADKLGRTHLEPH